MAVVPGNAIVVSHYPLVIVCPFCSSSSSAALLLLLLLGEDGHHRAALRMDGRAQSELK